MVIYLYNIGDILKDLVMWILEHNMKRFAWLQVRFYIPNKKGIRIYGNTLQ